MKRKFVSLLMVSLIATSMLAGCGNNSDTTKNTEAISATETAHQHNYTETITLVATCETDGEATYTCECGDTYTEAIPATGHSFTNYVYNEDATYEADGTETAKCDNCDETDTRTAEGTQLAYTYTDMDATKYAKSSVNVRNMPGTDGEKLGSLSFNQEVKVTGQCNETGWYRIEYSGETAYVSDSYLVDNKVETAKNEDKSSDNGGSENDSSASSSSSDNGSSSDAGSSASSSGPTVNTIFYDNRGLPYFYVSNETYGTESYYGLCDKACAVWNYSGDYGLSMRTGKRYTLMYTVLETLDDLNTTPEELGINTSCLN